MSCQNNSGNVALHEASSPHIQEKEAWLVPRVPSHDPNVILWAQVSNLAFGTTIKVVANHRMLPSVLADGRLALLRDVPMGTLYDVSLPSQPRGQLCSISPTHGAVGPHTPDVQIQCRLWVNTANNVNDTVVFGQADDMHVVSQSPPSADYLLNPWGKVFTAVDGTLFVADRGNHRVMGYYPTPISGASATMVLGQNNDFSGSAPQSGTVGFNAPGGVGGGNGLLVVADTNNHRVLMYEPIPYGQVDPYLVLGQSNLTTTSPGCGPAGLTAPQQAVSAGNMLLVADTGNHRVLVWNNWPTSFGTPADVALGQMDLASCSANQGSALPSAVSLSSPQDVWTDQNSLAVADYGNRRVLVWLDLPVVTGQPADLAVGQPDLLSGGNSTTSATSLNGPVSVVFDDNTLFVADAVDNRVLAYTPVPTTSGAQAMYALGQYVSTGNSCNQGNLIASNTLCNPTGVSFVGGDLAVTDSNNNRVLIYYSDPNKVPVGSFLVVVSPPPFFMSKRLRAYDAQAGQQVPATVTALDFNGQVNTHYRGTINFRSTDPNAILPAPYTYVAGDAGVQEFNATFFKAGTHTLAVYDVQQVTAVGDDPNVVIAPGNANYLTVTGFPINPNSAQVANFVVTAYDAYSNVATGFGGTISFSSSDPAASLPSPYTFTPIDQGAHAFTAALLTPGNQSITVNANGLAVLAGTQPNIIVAPIPRPLGGTVSGMVTGNVTLTNLVNGDAISAGNGNFVFDQNVMYGQNFNVVVTQPNGQNCSVANGNGVMGTQANYNVVVTCAPQAYTLGGSVVGLVGVNMVTLYQGDDTVVSSNGNFTFPTAVVYNTHFSASLANPNGHTCVFVGNSNAGIMPAGTDMNIRVSCTPNLYSLGGRISGLLSNTNVLLSDGNDTVSLPSGAYNFPTLLPYGRVYSIGLTNPNGQTCVFSPNTVSSGTIGNANVANANVVCSTNSYALGGNVTGLVTGNITLTNTINADSISVGNGNYLFDQNVAYAGNYNVVASSPTGLSCNVSNGNGIMPVGGNTNVNVTCTPIAYTLGGVVSGLLSNTNVTLSNANDSVTPGNGNFTFPTGVAYNSNFNVSLVNPNGQTCAFVSNSNAGVMPPSNDMNVRVVCTTNIYTLGGRVTGLLANTNVTLSDGNDTMAPANGSYTFPTGLPYARAYAIAITNPNGQTCVFSPNSVASGTMSNANVTNANVVCTTNSYALGGRVTGLVTGNITLTNMVNTDVVSVGNGNYLFDQNIAYGGNYNVVATAPAGLACSVSNGNAVMPVGGNTNVNVACTPISYTLGGSVSGLVSNTNVTLKNGNDIILSTNGNFAFPTGVAYNSNFNASLVNPNGQTCVFALNSNAGVMPPGNDTNIVVSCTTNTYVLGGSVTGLLANTNVTLKNGNDTLLAANGNFTFPTSVAYNSNFSASLINPNGQTCVFVSNSNTGVMPPSNDTNILVTCTTNLYALGGSISGLLTNTNVAISDGNDAILPTNGTYTFPTSLPYARVYSIGLTNPNGQTCVFSPNSVGSGTMSNANVTNANITCSTNTYALGGQVTGLTTGNITLTNTVNADVISVPNGNYVFDQNVAYTGNYNVVATSPAGLSCTVSNGNGAMPVGGNTHANVACTPITYTLGGTVSGLPSNTNVTLKNGNDTILPANGNFTFPTGVAYNSNFNVSLINPNGQTCIFVSNSNAGVMPPSNAMNVQASCSTNTYTLGGSVTGLLANTNVTLADGNDTISQANGSYIFPTLLPYNRAYSIGITNPSGQSCVFSPNAVGSGTMGAAPVTNANVVCTTNTYALGGFVTGLVTGNITLTNTVNADVISVGNGNYLFDQNVVYGGNYNVVATSPAGLSCSVSNGNAVMAVGGNSNVNVACVPNSYILGGVVSGLLANTNVTLKNANDTILPGNGNFVFPTGVVYNSNFSASLINPNGQICVFVSNSNAGVMPPGNDMNIVVSCTTNLYALGGSISGLLTNTNVMLADGNDTIARTNGTYSFPTSLPYARSYSIGITNPNGKRVSSVLTLSAAV